MAEAGDAISKAANGGRLVLAHDDCSQPEAVRLAKMLLADRDKRVLAFEDGPGLAESLEPLGVYLWKVRGAEGALFVSAQAPALTHRLIPVSKQADFPKARPRTFSVLRKQDEPNIERQIVYGIVLEPETVDSQGDVYSATEIELAAHRYMEEFLNIGHMHEAVINQSAAPVESFIAPCDFEMGGQAVKRGTWVMAVHVLNPDLWEQVKTGALTGFSIGGYASRVPVAGQ